MPVLFSCLAPNVAAKPSGGIADVNPFRPLKLERANDRPKHSKNPPLGLTDVNARCFFLLFRFQFNQLAN